MGLHSVRFLNRMVPAMARYVVNNPYHLWAHETQSHARNSSDNRSFRGALAYSYSTVVASIQKDKKGNKVYLLTSETYSVTTTRQMGEIRSAIPSYCRVFYVPYVDVANDMTKHRKNVQWLWEQVSELEGKAARARAAGNRDWYGSRAVDRLADITAYVEFFKVKNVKKPTGAQMGQAEQVLASQRKRDAAELKRQEKIRLENLRVAIAEAQEHLVKWLAGENAYYNFYQLPSQYLRIVGNEVETTHRATVPAHHVQKALPMVLKFVESGRAFKCPPETPIRLGHYQLTEITKEGTVIIGCHRFEKSEVLRFAPIIAAYVPESEAETA